MNRETWLNEMAARMAPRFAELGHPLPAFRVSVGFTSAGMNGRANGECWNKSTTADAHFTILISPTEASSLAIVSILNHELIHAAVGLDEGHKGKFAELMQATGMLRPFTTSKPGDAFRDWVTPFLVELGHIPHSPLVVRQAGSRVRLVRRDPAGMVEIPAPEPQDAPAPGGDSSAPPKQTARLLKAACEACGYTVRVTAKWLEVGPPHCPAHGAMATC